MIIVKMQAGLGNQMCEYAYYRKLSSIHDDVKMDILSYRLNQVRAKYRLESVFKISGKYATIKEVEKLSTYRFTRLKLLVYKCGYFVFGFDESLDSEKQPAGCTPNSQIDRGNGVKSTSVNLLKFVWRNSFKPLFTKKSSSHYVEMRDPDSKRTIFNKDYESLTDVYYDGIWGNHAYYSDIMNVLRDDFTFKIPLNGKNLKLDKFISAPGVCSVSVHIRRGDYLKDWGFIKYDVVKSSYYKKALNVIEKSCADPVYIIFSNDPHWVKKNMTVFKNRNCIYVYWNKGDKSYIDMQLMSRCKHNIIANSSFSIWGAVLNRNEKKIVISPANAFIYEGVAVPSPKTLADGTDVILIE